jgi:hypothetical protein
LFGEHIDQHFHIWMKTDQTEEKKEEGLR